MQVLELTRQIHQLLNKASYYNCICNNEISNEYLQEAKKLLDNYLKKVEETNGIYFCED